MIVVRTRDSRMFEEAYFVMRRDANVAADELDMLWEAIRILENTVPHTLQENRSNPTGASLGKLRRLLWFGLGLISGGGLVGLLWFLI